MLRIRGGVMAQKRLEGKGEKAAAPSDLVLEELVTLANFRTKHCKIGEEKRKNGHKRCNKVKMT